MRVSVCMIVRNEELLLPRAVASTAGLADEVVVLDTGSEDRTVEVASELGCVVLTGGDRWHKGESRNQALGAAQGEWCVVLDADETIQDAGAVRRFLEGTDAHAVYIRLAYVDGKDRPTLSYQQMRMWRRGTYRYEYRAHEVPTPVEGWGKLEYTELVWQHRPPAGRAWKGDYTLKRLLMDVEEHPESARQLYYLGREYMYREEWEPGIETLKRYMERAGLDKADAWDCLARCYGGLGKTTEQIQALHQACAAGPHRREWWCELAALYHTQGKNHIAVGLLRCALEIPPPETDYYNAYWHGQAIYDLLARGLWRLGRYQEGLPYAQKAVELEPENTRLHRNLLWFQAQLGDMDAFYELHGPTIHSGCGRHRAIAELTVGPRVLDYGCGTGDLLLILQEQHPDWELYGCDTSQVALEMARERGVQASLSVGDLAVCDTVVASQVLEHMEDDAAAVELLAKHCRQRLIVSVPNNGAVPSADHKRNYNVEQLTRLLGRVGPVKIEDWPGMDQRILATVEMTQCRS